MRKAAPVSRVSMSPILLAVDIVAAAVGLTMILLLGVRPKRRIAK